MNFALAISLALILDAVLGEPDWAWSRVPHPAVVIGKAIGKLEKRFNRGKDRKFKGLAVIVALCLAALLVGRIIGALPGGGILEVILAAILLAQKSLVEHVRAVADGLRLSPDAGRDAVAKIVGRDTRDLDQSAIARGAIESAAENFSDGLVAPVFWFLIAGLPGLLVYKTINTADSMVGYRTPELAEFGWASARIDDIANWVPARLSAGLIALSQFRPGIAPLVLRDAPLHRSPNAGWPEAAMAASLEVSLAGPRSYDGETSEFPFVYPEGRRALGPDDIDLAASALWRAWALLLAGTILASLV